MGNALEQLKNETKDDVKLYGCIKELYEQGVPFEELKVLIPDIKRTREQLQMKRILENNNEILMSMFTREMSFLLDAKERQEEEQFKKLKEAGASRVHCNLETSERFFPQVCTTHSFAEKKETLKAAKRAGLSLCSGGIMGLGETMEDRIDMVLTARELGVKSIPVNLLNPIPGTPYEHNRILSNDELCRITAIFRFLLPDGMIRLAGGRGLIGDKGEKCFRSGANAAISGDMLTTAGITVETDMELMKTLGYEVKLEDTGKL